jgi:hypothetical protein
LAIISVLLGYCVVAQNITIMDIAAAHIPVPDRDLFQGPFFSSLTAFANFNGITNNRIIPAIKRPHHKGVKKNNVAV